MNDIKKSPSNTLGYHFIEPAHLPKGEDEYYLRDRQRAAIPTRYRQLTAHKIEVLVRNGNTSDNWSHLLVSDAFTPGLVQHCKFFGLVRIGKLEPWSLEFHNLRRPVGLYNSTIISCDLGDNLVVDNVNYLSHYIIGNDAMIVNVNELATTDNAKFGNGILKQVEPESRRIYLELCNENGGRRVIPFEGMLAGDAWLWSRFREDTVLQQKLLAFTEEKFDNRRGYYGRIGDRTVVKNCRIIKDTVIGTDAYLKGANKLKNLTINSSAEAKSQIGEGCELVNGIVGYGCRIFYGVKAVRFVMGSHSQLKYGARLINSYLGDNSTISCCEVLNSLLFPAHEQHHNNSFLCAALLMGQSNMAAGATIGSNHNSRGPDGELTAGRGFWPGLCVSLKHNSRFACFTILAKGDYPAELDIPIPFSLVSNDTHKDELVVMPAYWFLHNLYALSRNASKYLDRDKRTAKIQQPETDFLAPDSIDEIITALGLLELFTGKAWFSQQEKTPIRETEIQGRKNPREKNRGEKKRRDRKFRETGRAILQGPRSVVDSLDIWAEGFENHPRKTRLLKVYDAWHIFRELVAYHAVTNLKATLLAKPPKNLAAFRRVLPSRTSLFSWKNVGGQLIRENALRKLIHQIHSGKTRGWDSIHQFYSGQGERYLMDKSAHALAALYQVHKIDLKKAGKDTVRQLFLAAVGTREWMTKNCLDSRKKDHQNPFRRMLYASQEEMDAVLGSLDDNGFLKKEQLAYRQFKKEILEILRQWGLGSK